jgi:hypothetical protein
MEASMHGSSDKRPEGDQIWSIKLVALPLLIVVALIAMVVSHPSAIEWILDAAQAEFAGSEFVGTEIVPDSTPPAQQAQPTNQIRTVHAK